MGGEIARRNGYDGGGWVWGIYIYTRPRLSIDGGGHLSSSPLNRKSILLGLPRLPR